MLKVSLVLKTDEDLYYEDCIASLLPLIPDEEYHRIMSQKECELEHDFLGFINVYRPLSLVIPKHFTVIDFGCYVAAQSYYFKDHKRYIGVDVCKLDRFTPKNADHYYMKIQDYMVKGLPRLLAGTSLDSIYAICSYVPDRDATKMVRETFHNVTSYYPYENGEII